MLDSSDVDPAMLEDIKSYAPDKVAGFVRSALSDMFRHYNGLHQAQNNDDVASLEIHIHSIKSVAAQFGANKLAAVCDEIENAAMSGNLAQCKTNLPVFEDEYKKAVVFFEEYIAA